MIEAPRPSRSQIPNLVAILLVTLLLCPVASAMMHPGLGRFMQRDPEEYVDGMALYQYVRSEPLARRDQDGRSDDKGVSDKPHPGPPTQPITSCKTRVRTGFPIPHVQLIIMTDQGCFTLDGQGPNSMGVTILRIPCPPAQPDDTTHSDPATCNCLIGNENKRAQYNKSWEGKHWSPVGPNSGTALRCWIRDCPDIRIKWFPFPAPGWDTPFCPGRDCPQDPPP
jgi:hypothetical protein